MNSTSAGNSFQYAAISYNTLPDYMRVIAPDGAVSKENYIQRSIAILGAITIKPFNKVQNNADFIACIREGLPRKALDNLMEVTGITTNEMTGLIRTSGRTLRTYTPQQKFNAEQTEWLIEIAKLYSRGEEVFGSLMLLKIG